MPQVIDFTSTNVVAAKIGRAKLGIAEWASSPIPPPLPPPPSPQITSGVGAPVGAPAVSPAIYIDETSGGVYYYYAGSWH